MQVRFKCPACGMSHVLDMPETVIPMTCSRTGKHLELHLGLGGEVKAKIVGGETVGAADAPEEAADE